jgi:hypothetical protein
MLKQQQLQLQQAGLGAQMAGQGAGTAADYYKSAGGILGNLENMAAQRTGIAGNQLGTSGELENARLGLGGGFINNALGNELGRVGTYGNLGIQGQGLDLSRMNAGSDYLSKFYNIMNQGGSQLSNLLGQEQNYALGSGQLMGNLMNNQGNIFNNIGQLQQGAGSLANNQTANYYNWMNNLLGARQNDVNSGFNTLKYGFDPTLQMGNTWGALTQGTMGPLGSMFTGQGSQPNAWMGNALQTGGSILGGLFGMIPSGSTGGSKSGWGGYDPYGSQG